MKISIIIFNYNYSKFLPKLFESLNYAINNDDINIFFCDDGSSDESLSTLEKIQDNLKIVNLIKIQVSPEGNKRVHPSHGQIDGILEIIDSYSNLINDFIWLFDSDDWFSSTIINDVSNILDEEKFFLFNTIINTNSYDDLIGEELEIKRNVKNINMKIWPTICVTSGILIKKDILLKHKKELLCKEQNISDIWLDARINLLAINYQEKVFYTNFKIYRYLHGNNDSKKMTLYRIIQKQLNAYRFFNFVVTKNLQFSFRWIILSIIDKIFYSRK